MRRRARDAIVRARRRSSRPPEAVDEAVIGELIAQASFPRLAPLLDEEDPAPET